MLYIAVRTYQDCAIFVHFVQNSGTWSTDDYFCLYADAPFKMHPLTISASFISITMSYENNGG